MKDYYNVLGISTTATQDDIKAAYRRLAVRFHPDVSTEPRSAARFAEVSEAFSVLGDPASRASYDIRRVPSTPMGLYSGTTAVSEDPLYEMLRRHQQAAQRNGSSKHFGVDNGNWHERQKFWEQEKQAAAEYRERRMRRNARMHHAHASRVAKVLATQWPAHAGITKQDVVVGSCFAAACGLLTCVWAFGLKPEATELAS